MTDNPVSWDLLICSIERRTEWLANLLAHLERQLVPGVGVRVFRDNQEVIYGTKCQTLLESSRADYVSFLDDDDWVEPDFVPVIMDALQSRPEYVGFKVKYTIDGNPAIPVYHTLRYGGWRDTPEALYRDIVHFNPIRRDLALQGVWEGGDGADRRWADQLRAKGVPTSEIFIDRELHHYQFRWAETFTVSSQRPPLTERVPRPNFDFVTWIGT